MYLFQNSSFQVGKLFSFEGNTLTIDQGCILGYNPTFRLMELILLESFARLNQKQKQI